MAAGAEERRNPSSGGEAGWPEVEKGAKEGRFLLGTPTFVDLGSGRWRCAESGHEMLAKERDSYAGSRACRFALIDAAVAAKKPPLNAFDPHPASKSQLICKLTGDTINKTEEQIWKHINGKRFQNKLEQMENNKPASKEAAKKDIKKPPKQSKSSSPTAKKNKKQDVSNDPLIEGSKAATDDSDKHDFWTPPVGDRWDFDDGRDRWESCTSPHKPTDNGSVSDNTAEKDDTETREISIRTKRMLIAAGPSSFASRKKKIKKTPAT